MDLSDPLRAIVPTLDGPVLRVLAGTSRPLTGREVWRLAGAGSEAGVRRVLGRLVEQGLVTATKAGQADLYSANRFHLAWPTVESLVHLDERLWERLTSLVADWDPAPTLVGVFGSAARGDGSIDSDIDLLLIRPNSIAASFADSNDPRDEAWARQVDNLRTAVRSMTGNPAQIVEVSDREMRDLMLADDPLMESLRSDLRVLVGVAPWEHVRTPTARRRLAEARA